jgi:hypothetical protein
MSRKFAKIMFCLGSKWAGLNFKQVGITFGFYEFMQTAVITATQVDVMTLHTFLLWKCFPYALSSKAADIIV